MSMSRNIYCLYCNSQLKTRYATKFCNLSCSAKHHNNNRREQNWKHTSITIKKIKNTLLETRLLNGNAHPHRLSPFPYTRVYNTYCEECNKLFFHTQKIKSCCSKECVTLKKKRIGQMAGKKLAAKNLRRSKDEILLYNLCKEHFSVVNHNQIISDGWDADIVIYDIKTVIFWNGPWHYKSMPGLKHSLEQVRNRDRIKENLFKLKGWNVCIFEDRYYTPQSAFNKLVADSSTALD